MNTSPPTFIIPGHGLPYLVAALIDDGGPRLSMMVFDERSHPHQAVVIVRGCIDRETLAGTEAIADALLKLANYIYDNYLQN